MKARQTNARGSSAKPSISKDRCQQSPTMTSKEFQDGPMQEQCPLSAGLFSPQTSCASPAFTVAEHHMPFHQATSRKHRVCASAKYPLTRQFSRKTSQDTTESPRKSEIPTLQNYVSSRYCSQGRDDSAG